MELKAKTVLITGATAGIGLAAAEMLAPRVGTLIGISRDADKCRRVAERLRRLSGNPNVDFFSADLSSLVEVRRAAGLFLERYPRLEVLINNAGGFYFERRVSADGLERTFALNHLNYFLLTDLLLERLRSCAPARIINVSSNAQFSGQIHFEDPQLAGGYGSMKAYAQSKLANMLFTVELARRLAGSGVTVNAMHPGLVRTHLAQDNGWLARLLQPLVLAFARSPRRGADTIVYQAVSPKVEGVSGKFFVDRRQVRPARAAADPQIAGRLWDLSVKLVALSG